ncbi:MAG: DUF4268 domain-containing protein [Bacteroidales bacterium]|nr:DUF4268 domain-containing protein [Candidatus Scybalocola fimicaballi]MCQ2190517.1 DUF4268 domain-containing protein [Paludibacteraceae bacterium]
MYSREEVKELKRDFWNGFDEFCAKLPRFKYKHKKWILYNTKIKGVEMKFGAGRDGAYVILELNHRNPNKRAEKWELLKQYKVVIEEHFDEPVWQDNFIKECGTPVSRIYKHKPDLDIHRRDDWREFYVFLSKEMSKLEKAFNEMRELLQDEEENTEI